MSASGTLVYLPGPEHRRRHTAPVDGSRGEDDAAARLARELVQSAASRPTAAGSPWRSASGTSDIWVYEWARDTLTRLTSDPDRRHEAGVDARWPPHRVRFGSRGQRDAEPVLAALPMGQATPQRLTESKNAQQPGVVASERQVPGV